MENHFVDTLRNNEPQGIKELYGNYRSEFLSFTKKNYKITEADSLDIYQDSFLAIRKHAITGNLYEVNSSFKTYLFGIGKHLIYKKLKENSKSQPYELHKVEFDYEEISLETTENLTKEQELLRHFFKQLGKSCQHMLTLSFYRGLTNEEIATLEGYESEAVVRSQKSRCLKTLKELIKNPK